MAPVEALQAVDAPAFDALRRTIVLEHCKWDPQVGDVSTLAPFPLLLPATEIERLNRLAETLAAELLEAETELAARPELHSELGIPRALRSALQGIATEGATPAAARIMRFDFHPTADGWRLSEVNSDVPGGYTESASLSALMAAHYPGMRAAGDPMSAYGNALAEAAHCGRIALVAGAGFMEDLQVVSFLARTLDARGCEALVMTPEQLLWDARGHAQVQIGGQRLALDAVVRFYQCEWLPRLPSRTRWPAYIAGGRTPVANPGTALLTESKRWPLVWDRLRTRLPAWRSVLPETRPASVARNGDRHDWLLKPAYGNNGDDIVPADTPDKKAWRAVARRSWFDPRGWLAQRRFDSVPVSTPAGAMHLCLGIYVVNGAAAGYYGRVSTRPMVDYQAIDIAVLTEEKHTCC